MTTRTFSTLHWFKKDLRLHDNPSLKEAVRTSKELRLVYILDPQFVQHGVIGFTRWRFLLQSLKNLDENLHSYNSRLYVVQESPQDVFAKLFEKWSITQLSYEVETEPEALELCNSIDTLAENSGIKVIKKVSHSLYDLDRILEVNNGKPPAMYKGLLSIIDKIGQPPRALPRLSQDDFKECSAHFGEHDEKEYAVPSLEDLNISAPEESKACLFPGGETEALERLETSLKDEAWVRSFEKPNTSPNSLEPSTTVLSPYLQYGCLSARLFYHKLRDIYKKAKKYSQPPVSLHGQLLWREFFFLNAYKVPNFNKMKGNPVCLQVDWDDNPEYVKAWAEARTGYPFIDAIMTQLRQEGWIHHLARHAVACFLTRGDLWISWEEGLKVFEKYLLDADWSLNAGNWLWLSASAFFHAYFRVYSPVAFGKKTDETGNYIRKYLPILKKYPNKYIYEPWKAPKDVQKGAGCIIGKDYPWPIVDHDRVRKRNIERMAQARKGRSASGDKDTGDDAEQAAKKGKKRESTITKYLPKKKGKAA